MTFLKFNVCFICDVIFSGHTHGYYGIPKFNSQYFFVFVPTNNPICDDPDFFLFPLYIVTRDLLKTSYYFIDLNSLRGIGQVRQLHTTRYILRQILQVKPTRHNCVYMQVYILYKVTYYDIVVNVTILCYANRSHHKQKSTQDVYMGTSFSKSSKPKHR